MRRIRVLGGLGALTALAAFVLQSGVVPGIHALNHVAMICGVGPGIQ
jgi:hypothetical protein